MSKERGKEDFFTPARRESKQTIEGLGRVLTGIDDIVDLASRGKSIAHPNWGVKPALFILNMPAVILMRGIKLKAFREYVALKDRNHGE